MGADRETPLTPRRYLERLLDLWAPIYRHAQKTQALYDQTLSARLGREVWLKQEHLQPGGSYKIRPAAASLAALSPAQRLKGVVAASGGNFAVSLALAAQREGVPLTLVMPKESFEEKRQFLTGAQVLFGDQPGYDAAEEKAKDIARTTGRPFLSPTEGQAVYLGNATIAFELIEDIPNLACIIGAVGGGGLCIGLQLAAAPVGVQVLGASPEAANAMAVSLQEGRPRLTYDNGPTWAEPLTGGIPRENFERAQGRLKVGVVSEEELRAAMRALYQEHGLVVEAAGASAYALLLSGRCELPEGPVAVVLSGGNLSEERQAWLRA